MWSPGINDQLHHILRQGTMCPHQIPQIGQGTRIDLFPLDASGCRVYVAAKWTCNRVDVQTWQHVAAPRGSVTSLILDIHSNHCSPNIEEANRSGFCVDVIYVKSASYYNNVTSNVTAQPTRDSIRCTRHIPKHWQEPRKSLADTPIEKRNRGRDRHHVPDCSDLSHLKPLRNHETRNTIGAQQRMSECCPVRHPWGVDPMLDYLRRLILLGTSFP